MTTTTPADFPKAGTSENRSCAQPLAHVRAFRCGQVDYPRTPTYTFRVRCACGLDVTTNYRDDANALAADHNNQGGQK